jgi:molybdopterin synthase sulfur carrier subunit
MIVNVLFFGATAHATGKRRIERDVGAGERAAEVYSELLIEYPQLGGHRLHLSVNQQFATGDEVLHDGDELAIFTPVSGG